MLSSFLLLCVVGNDFQDIVADVSRHNDEMVNGCVNVNRGRGIVYMGWYNICRSSYLRSYGIW